MSIPIIFTDKSYEKNQITTAILIKEQHFNRDIIRDRYVLPLEKLGLSREKVIAFSLPYDRKTVTADYGKEQLNKLLVQFKRYKNLTQFIVADSAYFKLLSKGKVVKKFYGEKTQCQYAGYTAYEMVYVPNWSSLFYNPANQQHIDTGLQAAVRYQEKEIVDRCFYIRSPAKANRMFSLLKQCHSLSCDIETTGLPLGSELVSISFAWSTKSGCAIYLYGKYQRKLLSQLKRFFQQYQGKLIFHRALFDVKHLIWTLFMRHPLDYKGMQQGLDLFAGVEDSQVLTYLALNSTTDVSLGLKENSYEFTGNYGIDVTNAANIPPHELLEYNLKDALATRYVWAKYWPVCEKDNQLRVYAEIFQPSIKPLLKMMLVGLPIDLSVVNKVENQLKQIQNQHEQTLFQHPEIAKLNIWLQRKAMEEANAKLKKKFHPISKFSHIKFNPESDPQIRQLIYEQLGYPVLAKTDTGLASTKAKVLEQLIGQGVHDDILIALIERAKTSIILSTFITAFKKYTIEGFLHGELNLGGTQSGRLSCCAAWTPVLTKRGELPISEVLVGDYVWTHKRRWRKVSHTWVHPADKMVDVMFCNGYNITCTMGHRLYVPNRGWMSIQEIIDASIEEVDCESIKHSTSSRSIPSNGPSFNNTANSQKVGNNGTQCSLGSQQSVHSRRKEAVTESTLSRIKAWFQEPYARKVCRQASQLYRRLRRWLRLFDQNPQWQTSVCPSHSYGRSSGIDSITKGMGCPSYRWGSHEQCSGQSLPDNSFGPSAASCNHGQATQTTRINTIRTAGTFPVYDITVEEDESYLSGCVYSHNSSNPNLQNLPSGSTYGKLIKSCFLILKDWLIWGIDFNALEERIGAILSNDPNRIKVYTQGFDGHCLRAFRYFGSQMEGIDPSDPASINSIQAKYPKLRNRSKAPTFALQYMGTYFTLMKNCGIPKAEAKMIEKAYHELYAASDLFAQRNMEFAAANGYIECAFGLRLRTPLLKRSVINSTHTPYAVTAEGRSANNATTQSWGLLINRALIEANREIEASPFKHDILPANTVHDAIYGIVRKDAAAIDFLNRTIVKAMEWNDHPKIYSKEVPMKAELEIGRSWDTLQPVTNNMPINEIEQLIQQI